MKRSLVSFPSCFFALAVVLTSVPLLKAQHVTPSSTWTKPSLSIKPSGRCCSAMAFEWKMQETLLFGGFTPNVMYNDTWVWRDGWSQLNPVNAPSPRQGPWMVWDAAAANMVLFGGTDSAGNYLNDTWVWDGANWIQQFPPVSPPGRRFDTQGMTYDAAIQRVMLFGGINSSGYLGDTWAWDGIARMWTQSFPATSPSPRRTMLAYDYGTGEVVLFAGDSAVQLDDTWTWDGVTWTQQTPATSPTPRGLSSISRDNSLRRVVLFGGNSGPGQNLSDTWIWNGANWVELTPDVIPVGRFAAPMDYDYVTRGLVLFGGFGTTTLDDTWLFFTGSN